MKLSFKKIINILLISTIVITVGMLTFFVVGILMMGDKHKKEDVVTREANKSALNKYYFDFNEVVHYSIEVDEDEVFNSMIGYGEEKYKTDRDSIVTGIMIMDDPGKLTDASFESNMKEIGFKSKKLSESKFAELKEIFREKPSIPYDVSCMPVYRDIFVFKKNGKVSGIAKLCYDCEMSHFIGTSADTGNFGADGEFGKLQQLVK